MRVEKTVEVNGIRLQAVARMQTRRDGERVYRVRVSEGHYFRDLVVADSSLADEAVDRAIAMYLGMEGSSVMSKQKKTAKATGEAKRSAHKRAQGARGAKAAVKAMKATKVAQKRDTAQQGAPQAQEAAKTKKTGLVDAAILILRETGQPMNTKEVVDAVLSKGLWKRRQDARRDALFLDPAGDSEKGRGRQVRKGRAGQIRAEVLTLRRFILSPRPGVPGACLRLHDASVCRPLLLLRPTTTFFAALLDGARRR
jgi:hypothetical protein